MAAWTSNSQALGRRQSAHGTPASAGTPASSQSRLREQRGQTQDKRQAKIPASPRTAMGAHCMFRFGSSTKSTKQGPCRSPCTAGGVHCRFCCAGQSHAVGHCLDFEDERWDRGVDGRKKKNEFKPKRFSKQKNCQEGVNKCRIWDMLHPCDKVISGAWDMPTLEGMCQETIPESTCKFPCL